MIVIGITGPSGAGKGVVSDILYKHGFYIIDADAVYHRIISPPSPCLDELVENFGNIIIAPDGSLNRSILSANVFAEGNTDKLELLNKTTHKFVVNEIRTNINELEGKAFGCVIDAPLLIEAGLRDDCLFTIAVLANKDIRAARISKRDGISNEKAFARINAQKNDNYYISKCDHVVYNNGDIHELECLINNILHDRGLI